MRNRRALRILAVVAGAIVLLLVAAIVFVHTPPAKRFVLNQAQEILAKNGIVLEAVNFDYSFVPFRVSTGRVSIRSAAAPDLPPIFAAESFRVEIGLFDLIRGRYRIEDLVIANPNVRIVLDEKGRSNIPSSSSTGGPRLDLLVLKMRSTGGSLTFEDRSRDVLLRLPAWELAVDGSQETGVQEIQLKTGQAGEAAEVRYGGKTLAIQNVDTRMALRQRNEILDVNSVRLSSGVADVALQGTVENLSDPRLDLSVMGRVHLKPAREYLSLDQNIEGDLDLDATVQGRLVDLRVAGHVKGENLTAEMVRQLSVDTDVTWERASNRAQMGQFQARSPLISVSGTADVALAATAGESNAAARLDAVNIEQLSRLLKLPVVIASRATGNASLRWPGLDFTRLAGAAGIRLTALPPATTARRVPLAGVLNVRARDGNAVVSIDSLDAESLNLRGEVTLESLKRLGGAISVETADSGQALKQIAAWSGNSFPEGLRLAGPLGADANLGGTLEWPSIGATVQAVGLQLNELKDIDLEAVAQYTREQIDVQRVALQWEGESLTGSGRIGLTTPSPELDARADVMNASIHRILAAFGQAEVPADGNINIAATVSGTFQDPAASISANGSDLQAYSEPLGTLTAEGHFRHQVLHLDSLSLMKPGSGPFQASGRYETNSGTYAIKADATDLKLNQVVLPQGTTIRANLNLNADGTGTVGDPGGVLGLSVRDLRVNEVQLEPMDLSVTVADRQARMTGSAPYYGFAANAVVSTVSPYPAEAEIRATDTDISRLPSERLKEFSGRVSAVVNAVGDVSDIDNARIRAEVPSLALNLRNHAITNDGPIDVQYANREVTISRAAIRMEDSVVQISGNLPLDAGSTGEVKIEGRTNLTALKDLLAPETIVEAQGPLVLDAILRGNLKRMDPEGTISITNGYVKAGAIPAPLFDVNLKATARDGRLVLEHLNGVWASAKISAQGEAPFALLPDLPVEIPRPAGPARLSADVQQFQISSLVELPEDTDGTVSMKIDAEASRPDIDLVQARVTFPDLKFHAGAYALEQVGASTLEIRNGVASVQQFELTGPQTNVRLAGTADLRNSRPIDLKLEGNTDAAVLALLDNTINASGPTTLSVAATGTVNQPRLGGFIEMQDGQARIAEPRIAAENLQLRLELNGSQIHVARLEGSLNGGPIKGSGDLNLFGEPTGSSALAVTADEIYFEFPDGLRTVSNAELRLNADPERTVLSGNIDVVEGSYTDPLTIEQGLLRYLESQRSMIDVNEEPGAWTRTQLDVGLRTLSPLVVRNNIAQGNINAELRILGTLDQPGLTGRIDVEEGAELRLRERQYSVDRGVITFTNDRAIEPVLDVEATTKASQYNITMKITGDATRKLDTVLTSDPPLGEADIVSVLATGRTLEQAGTAGAQVAKEQALSYVAGELGTSVTDEAGRALGLSQVRIEPNLIANEAEPTARLTMGKDITSQLNLVYSMNLRNSNDQIWIANYDITRRFSARGLRQNDNSYRFQFQHDVLFGLSGMTSTRTASNPRRKIGSVRFSGNTHFTEEQLESSAGVKAGDNYDFFSAQRGRSRLETAFAKENRLEAQVSIDRKLEESTVDLTFRIKEGPAVQLVFEGWEDMPSDLKDQVRDVWSEGVIDAQRTADVIELIESQLVRDRYFGSKIDSSIEMTDPDTKEVVFKIQPGSQYTDVRVAFEGIQAVEEEELEKVLKDGGFFDRDLTKRKQAVPLLENLYRELGYIDVNVEPPQNELDEASNTVRIVFRVTEGPLYRFGELGFDGNEEFNDADLAGRLSIEPETPFKARTVQQAQQTLQDLYRKTGYDDVEIQYRQAKDADKTIVGVTFSIQENRQRIFKDLQVEGTQKTSAAMVRTQIALAPGDIVSYDKLSEARTNLYRTGAYSFVEIAVTPVADKSGVESNQTGVRLVARVREIQPWQMRYGGFFDTERGPGGIVDFSNHNMLGSARVLGVQTRYDADLREVRTYFSQPTLLRLPVKSLFSAFTRREVHTGDDPESEVDDFVTHRTGFSPTFEYRSKKDNVFTFGYRFEKVRTFDKIANPLFPLDIRTRVAPLTGSFTRDTRDDPLDASGGRFTSHALDWGTAALGSQLRYIKYFGQYFTYLPFGEPTRVPWANTTRNRFLVALGARVGMAKGLGGQDVILSERFFAGGGTTVRGFEQDHLGPRDELGTPLGGDAMVVLNTELRFPLYKFFDGVAFVDAGNVYSKLSDFKPFGLRASYGFGLRIRTPYVVLRLDYGFKVNPRPGEPRGKFFGSIGQAF